MDDWEQPSLQIEKSNYQVAEFLEWRNEAKLVLSPSFQRGSVWTRPPQAYLLDTILRGFPIPPVHIRQKTDGNSKRLLREVVDGQQRLNAVFSYLDDEFPLAKPRQPSEPLPPWAGQRFSQLPVEFQRRILNYSFRCEVYTGEISDEQIYEIFARINTNSVPLTSQELRNGRYFGEFKQTVYKLADEHKPVWKTMGLFTSQALARMMDAEFVSEAIIVQIEGMQDKKTSIDSFYQRYDSDWQERRRHENLFRSTIDAIRTTVGAQISDTRFRRAPLYLYLVLRLLPSYPWPSERSLLRQRIAARQPTSRFRFRCASENSKGGAGAVSNIGKHT